LEELLEKYDAVFLGVGAGRGSLGIKGDHLKGVYSAIEVLTRVGLLKQTSFLTPPRRWNLVSALP
jgi:glutamate synthase (NADPH/NADH) small chain